MADFRETDFGIRVMGAEHLDTIALKHAGVVGSIGYGYACRDHSCEAAIGAASKETHMTIRSIELVTVETMPDHLIASHQAARNFGAYPHNGAERAEMTRDEADDVIASDEAGYAHEVSSRTVETLGGRRLSDPDEIEEPTHESADDWYDSLGYHVSTDDGDQAHPVCPMDEVDAYEPQDDAERDLLAYARAARDVAASVEDALKRAVDAWHARDLPACVAALDEASSIEREYGDDPAARVLRERLLVEVE